MKNDSDELLSVVVDDCIPDEPIDNYRKHLGLSRPLTLATVSLEKLHNQILQRNDDTIANTFLAHDEQDRFKAFRYQKRKREWLGGRIAAKMAVAEYLLSESAPDKINWRAWQIVPDTNGKPHAEPTTDRESKLPHISISHSADLAMALAAPLPCGVDIQKKTATVEKVRYRFSSPNEVSIMDSHNFTGMDETTKLTLLWAAKEAVRKTVDVSPLLGFKKITLKKIIEQYHDFSLLEFTLQPDNRRTKIPERIAVTVLPFTEYAVAFTTLPTNTG